MTGLYRFIPCFDFDFDSIRIALLNAWKNLELYKT